MRVLLPGAARGQVLVLDEALSFWGGVDPATGRIVDRNHPQAGQSVTGRIVYLPRARGSSSSSSVLAELLRNGLGPAGIILGEPDSILLVGALVAGHLYGAECPILVGRFPGSEGGMWEIDEGGIRQAHQDG